MKYFFCSCRIVNVILFYQTHLIKSIGLVQYINIFQKKQSQIFYIIVLMVPRIVH